MAKGVWKGAVLAFLAGRLKYPFVENEPTHLPEVG